MAQFWTDFSEYAIATGVPTGWQNRYAATDITYSIAAGGDYGGKVLRAVHTVFGRRAISWNTPGTAIGTTEVLARIRFSGPGASNSVLSGPIARGTGGAGTEELYAGTLGVSVTPAGTTRIAATTKYDNGVFSSLDSENFEWITDGWTWVRITAAGTTIETSFRRDEDDDWQIVHVATDSAIASGWPGLWLYDAATHECDFFSVGTGGDPALLPGEVYVEMDAGPLPSALPGVAYSHHVPVSGGVDPHTWALTAGALPDGLSLSGGGTISGTPTVIGEFTFTITVTDANGEQASGEFSINVTPIVPIVVLPPSVVDVASIVNEAEMEIVTREVGGEREVVWRLTEPFNVAAGETAIVTARDRGSPEALLFDAIDPTATDRLVTTQAGWEDIGGPLEVLYDMAGGLDGYFAGSENGRIWKTTDFSSWSAIDLGGTQEMLYIMQGGNAYIAATGRGFVAVKPSGSATWHVINVGALGMNLGPFRPAYGNGRWILPGGSNVDASNPAGVAVLVASTNANSGGGSWSKITGVPASPDTSALGTVVYTGDPIFTWIAGGMGSTLYVSDDGIEFRTVHGPRLPQALHIGYNQIAYSPEHNKIVAIIGGVDTDEVNKHCYVGDPDPDTWERHELPVASNWRNIFVEHGAVWLLGQSSGSAGAAMVVNRSLDPRDWIVEQPPHYGVEPVAMVEAAAGTEYIAASRNGRMFRLSTEAIGDVDVLRTSGATIPIAIMPNDPITVRQLQLRAKRVMVAGGATVRNTADASASIAAHGSQRRDGAISPDLSFDAARAVMNRYVERLPNGLPILAIEAAALTDEYTRMQMASREVGDRIRLIVPRREIDAEYIVAHIGARVTAGEIHTATYTLFPAPDA